MYSYPNYIPLPAPQVRRIQQAIKPWAFDLMHGAFIDVLGPRADQAVQRSADRYCSFITGNGAARDYF